MVWVLPGVQSKVWGAVMVAPSTVTLLPSGAVVIVILVVAAAETVKVTGILRGLLDAFEAVIRIVPVYVPAARPVGFAVTVKFAGVVFWGLTWSQLPPEFVVDWVVKVRAEPELEMLICWVTNATVGSSGVKVS